MLLIIVFTLPKQYADVKVRSSHDRADMVVKIITGNW